MSKERCKNVSTLPNPSSRDGIELRRYIWCPSNQKQNLILGMRLERFKFAWLGTGCEERRVSSSRGSTNSFNLQCKEPGQRLSSKPIRDLAIWRLAHKLMHVSPAFSAIPCNRLNPLLPKRTLLGAKQSMHSTNNLHPFHSVRHKGTTMIKTLKAPNVKFSPNTIRVKPWCQRINFTNVLYDRYWYEITGNICLDRKPGLDLTLGRPGGWIPPPWRFSPVTFFMIPIAKIASTYLLLGMGDTFWHMWHHLDAATWHMSWRHMYMTVVKIHCFYNCLLIERTFDVDVIK